MPIDIKTGMTFDEILAHGEDDSLFSALKSNVLNQIAFDTNPNADSEISRLLESLKVTTNVEEQARIVDAISATMLAKATELDNIIQADLVAQEAVKQKIANLNIAAELYPPENTKVPDLVDLIATPAFKEIFAVDPVVEDVEE